MGRFKIEDSTSVVSAPNTWPTEFTKPVIGLELEGIIIEDLGVPLISPSSIQFITGSLDAIRNMRLKGYRVMIITDQPNIARGLQTPQQMDSVIQYMMQIFGQAGILSIDGILYSTSDLKEDIYAKPNDGMFKKASSEGGIIWQGGWFVGHQSKDAKVSDKIGAIPVILKTGKWEEALKVIGLHANRDIKSKTLIFNNLLEFESSLP